MAESSSTKRKRDSTEEEKEPKNHKKQKTGQHVQSAKVQSVIADTNLGTQKSKNANAEKVELTSTVAMDCEMVGTGADGTVSILARCSIVNFKGEVIMDKYVKPTTKVTDFRTKVSGIKPSHLSSPDAIDFKACQSQVAKILKDRILVGHSIHHDLKVLDLTHPANLTRDTAYYKGLCPDRPRALKKLVTEILKIKVQEGMHDSVEDARAVLALYKMHRSQWEKETAEQARKHRHQARERETKKQHRNATPAATTSSSSSSARQQSAPLFSKKPHIQKPAGGAGGKHPQQAAAAAKPSKPLHKDPKRRPHNKYKTNPKGEGRRVTL